MKTIYKDFDDVIALQYSEDKEIFGEHIKAEVPDRVWNKYKNALNRMEIAKAELDSYFKRVEK